ncbi:hypothetical protein F5884DRAFT_786190 [Xylogone sp. PMI_703]|nr:hypothetical protein F5884DRAFT_786190 [Xylogone sp. PMI_703]
MDMVLSTPELLAAIIVNLSVQDILVNAMRVSHTWHTTVDTFPALQQRLFFASISSSPKRATQWTKNPLLVKMFPYWFNDFRDTNRFVVEPHDDLYSNPGSYKYYRLYSSYNLKTLPWASNSDAFSRSEASWRRMMVMQPAVTKLNIMSAATWHKKWSRNRQEKYIPAKDGGVRMGLLYDIVIGYCDDTSARFSIQWNMFDYEEDTASEYQGDGDFVSIAALEEKYEEEDSLTLIWANNDTDSRGTPRGRPFSKLGENFRSKSRDDMWNDAAKLIEAGIYTFCRPKGREGLLTFRQEEAEEERRRRLKEENYRKLRAREAK